MANVKFETKPVVLVRIEGYEEDGNGQGLIYRLAKHLDAFQIYPAFAPIQASSNYYTAVFTEEDAAKVQAWLLKNGAESGQLTS